MDFSGPPPLPDRFQHLQPTPSGGSPIPGVGVGYGYHNPNQNYQPPPPPQHQSASPLHTNPRPPQHPPPQDNTPTTTPTPGRPLLHNNKLLVYPRSHWCHKCQNTGYKNNDPTHPCSSDWRKYGKPYTGALAHSFSAGVAAAENFQRPLPHRPPPQAAPAPGAFGHYPGQQAYPRQTYQQPHVMTGYGYGRPPGALVLQPGDPRIGGQ